MQTSSATVLVCMSIQYWFGWTITVVFKDTCAVLKIVFQTFRPKKGGPWFRHFLLCRPSHASTTISSNAKPQKAQNAQSGPEKHSPRPISHKSTVLQLYFDFFPIKHSQFEWLLPNDLWTITTESHWPQRECVHKNVLTRPEMFHPWLRAPKTVLVCSQPKELYPPSLGEIISTTFGNANTQTTHIDQFAFLTSLFSPLTFPLTLWLDHEAYHHSPRGNVADARVGRAPSRRPP
jgi:hypothetical protein